MCYWLEMLMLVSFEYNHYTIAPSSGLKAISLMIYWEPVSMKMSFWEEKRRNDKLWYLEVWDFKDIFLTHFIDLEDLKLLQLFKRPKNSGPWWQKRSVFWCSPSINVSSSVSAKQQIPCSVSFLPRWEDCFFHQGQTQVTNWAVAASPIPLRWLYRSPLHSSQPPTYTQTYAPMC